MAARAAQRVQARDVVELLGISRRRPLAELVPVATGDVDLVFRDGAASDAASRQAWIFAVAQLEREVEDWNHSVASLHEARRRGRIERTQVRRRAA